MKKRKPVYPFSPDFKPWPEGENKYGSYIPDDDEEPDKTTAWYRKDKNGKLRLYKDGSKRKRKKTK